MFIFVTKGCLLRFHIYLCQFKKNEVRYKNVFQAFRLLKVALFYIQVNQANYDGFELCVY